MTNKKISNLDIGTLNYFMTRAFLISITFNAIIKSTKQNSWYIPILNIIPGILYILLISKIMDYEPDLSFPDKIKKLFKSKLGLIILILCSLYGLFLGLINYLNMGNFIQSQFLTKTPILVISIVFAIAAYYILTKGITTIGRTSTILFFINVLLFTFSLLGLLPNYNIDNLKPFFNSSISNNINSLLNFFVFNLGTIFMLLIIPKNKINKPKTKKSLILSFLISTLTLTIVVFSTLTIFGYELTLLYEYPEFHVLKSISLISLASRIESILVMQILFDTFICHIIIIYYVGNIIASLINTKKINLIYFILLIIFVISTSILSRFNIYVDNLLMSNLPIFSSIFITIIPIIILLKIKISK